MYDTGTEGYVELVNAGMIDLKPDGNPAERLAEQLPTIENGSWKVFPDGKMETNLTIRKGAKWHDGVPFNTEDLLFSLRVLQATPGEVANQLSKTLDKVEAKDDRTIVVSWKSPSITANQLFTQGQMLPVHLLGDAFKETPDAVAIAKSLPYFATDWIGNGPYQVTDFLAGSFTKLKAFDDFVLGRPKVDEVTVLFISDVNALTARTLSGEIRLTIGTGVTLDQALTAQKSNPDLEVIYSKYYQTQAVIYPQFINPNPSIQLNPLFRKALAYAIDRQPLLDAAQAGIGQAASALVSPTDPDYAAIKDRIVEYPYDPKKAIQMLTDLGLQKGGDGLLRDTATGQPFNIQVLDNIPNENVYLQTTLSVVDYWKQVGVGAESKVASATPIPQDLAERPGLAVDRLMTILDTRFLSSSAPVQENKYTGSNRARYQNPELDGLINKYLVTIPRTDHLQLLGDVMHHMTDNVVVIHRFYNVGSQLKAKKMINVEPRTSKSRIWESEKWGLV